MEPFLIIIIVSLIVNLLFVVGAIIYTFLSADKEQPSEDLRASTVSVSAPPARESYSPRRHSSHPQVLLYHNLVRMSVTTIQKKKTTWQRFGCGSNSVS
ncbi:hypothetical protein ABMA27_014667 [Loxostege sticticalis]|uniref:Uncharacterized protein n=1 Tax=Loxostege sticticalis TaxID=481309 RepID=A0ABR3I9T4_LOXSC